MGILHSVSAFRMCRWAKSCWKDCLWGGGGWGGLAGGRGDGRQRPGRVLASAMTAMMMLPVSSMRKPGPAPTALSSATSRNMNMAAPQLPRTHGPGPHAIEQRPQQKQEQGRPPNAGPTGPAAGHCRAADHDHGNAQQQVLLPLVERVAARKAGDQRTRQAGQTRADQIGPQARALDPQAGKLRGPAVLAERRDGAPEQRV